MPIPYRDEIRPGARGVIVLEALGLDEEAQGRPLAGATGYLINRWWHQAGLKREDFSILSVVKRHPPGSKLFLIPKEEIQVATLRLQEDLLKLKRINLIIPLGNLALQAVLGFGGIEKYRGSILGATLGDGSVVKTIPVIPPADTFQDPQLVGRCLADWRRIGEEIKTPEIRVPQRELLIDVRKEDRDFLLAEARAAQMMAVDIETNPEKGNLICVGFATRPEFAWTLPWDGGAIWQKEFIHELLALENEKVLQNGLYDTYWLRRFNLPVVNYRWDTLDMHHALDARETHRLAYLASIYTREPFWKDDAKDGGDGRVTGGWESFLRYNCRDAAVTLELQPILAEALNRLGPGVDFYLKHYSQFYPAVLEMMVQGITVDQPARQELLSKLQEERLSLLDVLEEVAGRKLRSKKSIGRKALQQWMYEDLKLPRQYVKKANKSGTRSLSTDNNTLKKLALRFPEKFERPSLLLQQYAEKQKLTEFLADKRVCEDGRFRFSLSFNTEAGRFSSKESPMGEGSNIQNQDRRIRHIFVPDPGHVLVEVDASQIESRFVFIFTGDPHLIELANTKPWEFDQHRESARVIGFQEIGKPERYVGKKVSHGAQRGMEAYRLQETMLKDGFIRTVAECEEYLANYHKGYPALREVYFRKVRQRVMDDRLLVNSWGRKWACPWDRLTDELYRKAYSYLPQSECLDHMNQHGLAPLWKLLQAQEWPGARLLAHAHDALLISTPLEYAWEIACFLDTHLIDQRTIRDMFGVPHKLVIPVETKVGLAWGQGIEFKRLPSRDDFMDQLKGLEKGGEE